MEVSHGLRETPPKSQRLCKTSALLAHLAFPVLPNEAGYPGFLVSPDSTGVDPTQTPAPIHSCSPRKHKAIVGKGMGLSSPVDSLS